MNFKNLNIVKLLQDSKDFTITENDSYVNSYPVFLDYFKQLDYIEKEHLIISSHFVYGWMPKVLQLDLNKEGEVLKLLNLVKGGQVLIDEEIEVLKKSINNSLVGLSKLLHFIIPNHYAIWDSRVLRYTTEQKSIYGIDKVKNYQEYLERINDLKQSNELTPLFSKVQSYFKNYHISEIRAIELVMFETDRRENGRLPT